MIGHEKQGAGPTHVVVLNDWISDTSSWEGARAYLDGDHFTWTFADLRGYGRSRGCRGAFTVKEAANDVMGLANELGWRRIAIVGHSMSSLVALHLAQQFPDRIDRAVVLAPPPPTGFRADEATHQALRAVARGDDSARLSWLQLRFGSRLSEGWIRFKANRWRACADPEAVAAYVALFAGHGLPEPATPIDRPVLAITGEHDAEVMRREAVAKSLAPLCARLLVKPLADCGHYPMQEAPPLLVAMVERFLQTAAVGADDTLDPGPKPTTSAV